MHYSELGGITHIFCQCSARSHSPLLSKLRWVSCPGSHPTWMKQKSRHFADFSASVNSEGFEPPFSWAVTRCSIQLCYESIK